MAPNHLSISLKVTLHGIPQTWVAWERDSHSLELVKYTLCLGRRSSLTSFPIGKTSSILPQTNLYV